MSFMVKLILLVVLALAASVGVLRFVPGIKVEGKEAFAKALLVLGGFDAGLSVGLLILSWLRILRILSIFTFGLAFLVIPAVGAAFVLHYASERIEGLKVHHFKATATAIGILAVGQIIALVLI
jgi:hypothetical protein